MWDCVQAFIGVLPIANTMALLAMAFWFREGLIGICDETRLTRVALKASHRDAGAPGREAPRRIVPLTFRRFAGWPPGVTRAEHYVRGEVAVGEGGKVVIGIERALFQDGYLPAPGDDVVSPEGQETFVVVSSDPYSKHHVLVRATRKT